MPALPSKSAGFVIHKLEQMRYANGEGISVRIDGRPIDDIVFEDGCVNIRPRELALDAAYQAFVDYSVKHGAGFDPREAMRAALGAVDSGLPKTNERATLRS